MKIQLLALLSLVVLFVGISAASASHGPGFGSINIVYQPTDLVTEEFRVLCSVHTDESFSDFRMLVTSVDESGVMPDEILYHSSDLEFNVKKYLTLKDGFYIQTVCDVGSIENKTGELYQNHKSIQSFDEIKHKKTKSSLPDIIPTITTLGDIDYTEFSASCAPKFIDDSLTSFAMVVAYYNADEFIDESTFAGFREIAFLSRDFDNRVIGNLTLGNNEVLVLFCSVTDGDTLVNHTLIVKDISEYFPIVD